MPFHLSLLLFFFHLCLGASSKAAPNTASSFPVHAPFHSSIMWLLGRDPSHPQPCFHLVTPTQTWLQVISFSPFNWSLDMFLRPYFLQVMEPLIASQSGLSSMTLKFLPAEVSLLFFLLDLGCICCLLSIPAIWFKLVPLPSGTWDNMLPPWMRNLATSHLWSSYSIGQLLCWKIGILSFNTQPREDNHISNCHQVLYVPRSRRHIISTTRF